MLPYAWTDLARWAGGQLTHAGTSPAARFVVDSRAVEPGDVFVALRGARQDGHAFLPEVFSRGASGCLVERTPPSVPDGVSVIRVPDALRALQSLARTHREKMTSTVIGITGSNGKTTTKEMLSHVLRAAGKRVLSTRGNLNSQIGLPLMMLEMSKSHTHAVLEMGASARGDIARLCELARPTVGVLTGIGRAHLEFFGSLAGVADAKWELVEALPSGGVAFLNADDPLLMDRKKSARCSVVTFGRSPGADVRAENIRQEPRVVFDLVMAGARRPVQLPVPGIFNVTNALAAAAVALWERVPLPSLTSALESFAPPPGRMEVRRRKDGTLFVLDAYNANPDSMAAGLRSFVDAYPERPRYAVLGSMLELGPHAEAEHRALGAGLAGLSFTAVYFVGAEATWVEEGYRAAGGRARFFATTDRIAFARALREGVESGAAVYFKGSRGARLEEFSTILFDNEGKD
ncbi:MAG TPA: UDP-N-acetylmuramoyl-tripeptide--D-alanyl-D-alanine ligase, partial [Elusimicrobiota bacterium]|nr:UDP-N-acetylmuramoyl-tripeptide--D-alanyl-D-alanine ligase [Elusimicrobiota bacterium]